MERRASSPRYSGLPRSCLADFLNVERPHTSAESCARTDRAQTEARSPAPLAALLAFSKFLALAVADFCALPPPILRSDQRAAPLSYSVPRAAQLTRL